jgi:hypothetical protein
MERPYTWQIDELGLEVTVRREAADAAALSGAEAFGPQLVALAAELRQTLELMVDRMSESNPMRRDALRLLETLDRVDRLAGRLRTRSRAAEAGDGPAGTALVAVADSETGSRAQAVLGRLGWRVEAAAEGDAPVDLLVADVVAPGGESGLALADRLRTRRAGLHAVLLAAFAGVEAAERLVPEVAFVAVPVREEALAAALEAVPASG